MENECNMVIVVIGYIIAFLAPIIGLVYGAILFYSKRDVPLYNKHSRFIIIFAIIIWIISVIARLVRII